MHPYLQEKIRQAGLAPERLAELSDVLEAVSAVLDQAETDRGVLERSLELTSTELIDGHLDLLRDLEKRKRLEVQLRETESKWLSLVEASPSLILTIAPDYTVASANRPFPGSTVEEMLGAPAFALFPDVHRDAARRAFDEVRRSGAAERFEIRREDGAGGTAVYDVEVLPILAAGVVKGLTLIATDITERIQTLEALQRSEEQFRTMFENSPTGIVAATPEGVIRASNPAFSAMLGGHASAGQGQSLLDLTFAEDREAAREKLHGLSASRQTTAGFEMRIVRPDRAVLWVRTSLAMVHDRSGSPQWLYAMIEDVTAQKQGEAERQAMEVQLRQSQKLEGIGQLASGIAHEINTPTQFIGDNLTFLKRGYDMLRPALEVCAGACSQQPVPEAAAAEIAAALQQARWDFLAQQIPRAIEQSLDGVNRVAKIVRAMKEFAHPSGAQKTPTDIRRSLESTLTVTRNEWKYIADVETDFDDSMPDVLCYGDELNQVFLNLIVNAAHAIGEKVGDGAEHKGRITIATRYDGDTVEVRIGDDGCGIPESIRDRIFDPFFTTKEVGKGSGQGLALAHAVVVRKHGGTIDVESQVGVGTTFVVRLPVEPAADAQTEARAA